jgi:hypothetical protein
MKFMRMTTCGRMVEMKGMTMDEWMTTMMLEKSAGMEV